MLTYPFCKSFTPNSCLKMLPTLTSGAIVATHTLSSAFVIIARRAGSPCAMLGHAVHITARHAGAVYAAGANAQIPDAMALRTVPPVVGTWRRAMIIHARGATLDFAIGA
jgi:hypothetical protein